MVDEGKRGGVDEDEGICGVDDGSTDGDFAGAARRGDCDVIMPTPAWEELAGHAAAWVLNSKFDSRPRACIATDAMVTLFEKPALRAYCNRGSQDAPGVGVEYSDVELDSDFSNTLFKVQRYIVDEETWEILNELRRAVLPLFALGLL